MLNKTALVRSTIFYSFRNESKMKILFFEEKSYKKVCRPKNTKQFFKLARSKTIHLAIAIKGSVISSDLVNTEAIWKSPPVDFIIANFLRLSHFSCIPKTRIKHPETQF